MPRASTAQAARPPRRAGALLLGVAPWLATAAMTALWARARRQPRPGLSRPEVAEPVVFEQKEPGRGRLAPAPQHIPPKGWKDIAWRTYREIGRDRLPAVAGGVTFYTLLAIFPAIGAFVSLYGLFADVGTMSKQLGQLAAFVPPEILTLIAEQMTRLASQRPANLSVAFVVSVVISVWSANAGIASLFDGLNIAYDETEKRNFFVRRVQTLGFTLGLLLFMLAVSGILVAWPLALSWLGWRSNAAWLVPFRWVLLFAVGTVAFAVLYRYGPSREQARWQWVWPGAAAAAAFWLVGSLGFSWYVNHVAHYDVTYGSLGAVVAFMSWIWFSVMVVLTGAELNAEIEHQTALDSTTGPPEPMGKRGAAMADTVGLRFAGVRSLWHDLQRQVRNLLGRGRAPQPPRFSGGGEG